MDQEIIEKFKEIRKTFDFDVFQMMSHFVFKNDEEFPDGAYGLYFLSDCGLLVVDVLLLFLLRDLVVVDFL